MPKPAIILSYTVLEGGKIDKVFLSRNVNRSQEEGLLGKIREYDHLEHNPFNHASHYATSVFEGIRTSWNSERRELYIINFDEHLDRLERSMKAMTLMRGEEEGRKHSLPQKVIDALKPYHASEDIYFSEDGQLRKLLKDLIVETLLANIEAGFINPELGNGYIRPLVTRSSHPEDKLGVHSTTHHITLEIMVQEWGSYLTQPTLAVYPEGIENPLRRHKCGSNYGFGSVAKDWATVQLAEKYGKKFDDALILNNNGFVEEATGANFFVWNEEGVLLTPPKEQYILPGTKRKVAINIARNLGILIVEEDFHVSMLFPQKEGSGSPYTSAFLTGTATGIEPIQMIYEPKTGLYNFFEPNDQLRVMRDQYQKMIKGEDVDSHLRNLQEAIVFNNRVDLTSIEKYR